MLLTPFIWKKPFGQNIKRKIQLSSTKSFKTANSTYSKILKKQNFVDYICMETNFWFQTMF
jgi:hypothetical protein